jgi:outer membrane beta-barrel protein
MKGIVRSSSLASFALALGAACAFAQAPDSAQAPAPPPATDVAPPAHAPATAPRPTTGAPLVSTRKVRLFEEGDHVARSGPGDAFALAGVYPKGATFVVLAKSGEWYNVRLSPSETGWFHASMCEEFEDLSDLEFRPNPKLYSRTGSFILSGYAGAYAFDRKSNSLTVGGRLGYYVLDRLHAEMGVGWTRVRRPAEIVESLFDLELEAEKFHMAFYDLGLTFEVLPGRQMVPFVTGGAGSSIMQGRSELSFNYGAGTMLYLSKKNAMRWEVRSYRFTSGSDDARQTNTNIAFTLGTSLLF